MDIPRLIINLLLFLCLMSICTYSALLACKKPYLGKMFKTKQPSYYGNYSYRPMSVWQKVFLVFCTIGGYICALKGTHAMLALLPSSRDGLFDGIKGQLTAYIAAGLSFGIVWVYREAADLGEHRRTLSNSDCIHEFIFRNFRLFEMNAVTRLVASQYASELEKINRDDLSYFARDNCLKYIHGELDPYQLETLKQGYESLMTMAQLVKLPPS